MIVNTAIQKISSKLWIDSFVDANLHPCHCFYLYECIKNIASYVKIVETYYFWNYKGSYYDSIQYTWKKMTAIKLREAMPFIDQFFA